MIELAYHKQKLEILCIIGENKNKLEILLGFLLALAASPFSPWLDHTFPWFLAPLYADVFFIVCQYLLFIDTRS